jgi:OOP family OmpA-OmpF porin
MQKTNFMSNFKKGTLVLLLAMASQMLYAQDFVSAKKGSAFGFSGNLVDFSASLPKIGALDAGYSIMYWKGLSKQLDLSLRYNGLFSDYSNLPGAELMDAYKSEFEASLHLRPAGDNHILLPFLTAGIGVGGKYSRQVVPYVPLGVGLQLNLFSDGYILLQGNYRASLADKYLHNNTFYSLGVLQTINYGKPKLAETPAVPVVVAPPVVIVKDRDNDGVPDSLDECPDQPGPASLHGCPDRDGDGIADKDDKCPDVPGLARYNGCPIPDTDHDGINDEEDKCPTVPGVARYNGCPIPDTDGDGINDEEDKCPTIPGTAANHGCPEVKAEIKKRIDVAAKSIYFATGSAKLLVKSNKALNAVAAVLSADNNLKIDINGYTDNVGKPDKNLVLSQNRAKAVYDYLVKKGITESRLKSAGFGQDQPIADNKTANGRSKNRRVELKLHYD